MLALDVLVITLPRALVVWVERPPAATKTSPALLEMFCCACEFTPLAVLLTTDKRRSAVWVEEPLISTETPAGPAAIAAVATTERAKSTSFFMMVPKEKLKICFMFKESG